MRSTTAAALVLALALSISGCGGNGGEKEQGAGDAPGTSAKKAADGAEGEEEPEPLMLGTQRYVSPCRLLGPDEVTQIYGDPGPYANFIQEVVEDSIPVAEMQAIGQTIGGRVRTVCRYSYDNADETSISLEVEQFPSPAAAMDRWKRIKRLGTGIESRQMEREGTLPGLGFLIEWAKENEANAGGDPVKGLDSSILFVAGKTHFTGVRNNLLLTLARKDYAGVAFEPKEVRGALSATRQAFDTIYGHADDAELDQSAVPSYWEQVDGWPTFLDACEVFDQEAMKVATGHVDREAESSSVLRDPAARLPRNSRPAFQAVFDTCRRAARVKQPGQVLSRSWNGMGEVWYPPPGETGEDIIDGVVLRKLLDPKNQDQYTIEDLIKGKVLREVTVEGSEKAYIFENRYRGLHFGWLLASVGDYVLRLDASRPSGKKTYDNSLMGENYLVAGAEVMAANIAELAEEAGADEED